MIHLLQTESSAYGSNHATYMLWEVDENYLIESSVLYLADRDIPWVVCMPSSVGCPMGCRMCGMPTGIPRFLTVDDLWLIMDASIKLLDSLDRFQVSFMGQGEPLLPGSNVTSFCSSLSTSFPGIAIGISTVGIAEGIYTLAKQPWGPIVRLQVSLHALPASKRMRIVPAESSYPVEEAIEASRQFSDSFGIDCCLNCVLLDGFNDKKEDAIAVGRVSGQGNFYVKVASLNEFDGTGFRSSPDSRVREYCETVRSMGVEAKAFHSIGSALGVGCGQTRLSRVSTPECAVRRTEALCLHP